MIEVNPSRGRIGGGAPAPLLSLIALCVGVGAAAAGTFWYVIGPAPETPAAVRAGAGVYKVEFDSADRILSGASESWELHIKEPGVKYELTNVDDGMMVFTDAASMSMTHAVSLPADRFRVVKWQWCADRLPVRGDVRNSETDDAIQFIVGFDGQRSIAYTWDSNAPIGGRSTLDIPFVATVEALIVETGHEHLGQWHSVERDVFADFVRLYGVEPTSIVGVCLQANSQYTEDAARATFKAIRFEDPVTAADDEQAGAQ